MSNVHRIGQAVRLARSTASGPAAEIANALALTMGPRLRQWREDKAAAEKRKEAAAVALAQATAAHASEVNGAGALQRAAGEQESALSSARQVLASVVAEPWGFFRFLWMWIWGGEWRVRHKKASEEVRDADARVKAATSASDEASRRVKAAEQRELAARAELREAENLVATLNTVPQVVSGVGYSEYPIMLLRLQPPQANRKEPRPPEKVLVVEPSRPVREMLVPEISVPEERLDELDEALTKIGVSEVLADAGDVGSKLGDWGGIFGRERALLEAARHYAEVLGEVRPRSLGLRPAAAGDRLIAEILTAAGSSQLAPPVLDPVARKAWDEQQEAGAVLTALLSRRLVAEDGRFARLLGGEAALRKVRGELDEKRSESREVTETQLALSLRNGELARYAFYCPLCSAAPRFLSEEFTLDLAAAERLDTESIWRGLTAYQAECFNTPRGKKYDDTHRASVTQSWKAALDELRTLEGLCRRLELELVHGSDDRPSGGAREARQLEREVRAHRRAYQNVVTWLLRNPFAPWRGVEMPGSEEHHAEPALGISSDIGIDRHSRMTYDPSQDGSWRCSQCGKTYSHRKARLGAVDRVRMDIAYPLIRTLWNHESIWSKTVDLLKDSRREVRDRQVEELGVLQPPITQFLDDTRQLRLQLQEAFAHGQATKQRLQDVAGQYKANGLLDDAQLKQLDAYVERLSVQLSQVDLALNEANASEDEMQQKLRTVSFERPLPALPQHRWIAADAARGLMPLNRRKEYDPGEIDDGSTT